MSDGIHPANARRNARPTVPPAGGMGIKLISVKSALGMTTVAAISVDIASNKRTILMEMSSALKCPIQSRMPQPA